MNKSEEIVLEPPLYFAEDNAQIWNVAFHPSADLIATSQINGAVSVYNHT